MRDEIECPGCAGTGELPPEGDPCFTCERTGYVVDFADIFTPEGPLTMSQIGLKKSNDVLQELVELSEKLFLYEDQQDDSK